MNLQSVELKLSNVDFIPELNESEKMLPSHWHRIRLENISHIVMGQSPPSETYNKNGQGLPFLQGKAEFTNLYPRPIVYCTKPLKIARQGTILISMRAPVGDVNIANRDYAIGRGLAAIEVKTGASHLFLFYFLLYEKENIKVLSSGSTFDSITRNILSSLLISWPPFPEQRAIAHILQTVQDAIQARRREIALERERKAALMQHLFTHGINNEPTRQSEIGEIPESWDIVPLGSVCLSSAFGPRFSSTFYNASGNIATLRTTDIDDDGNINYSTMPLAQLDIKRFEDHLLQRGDFLVTRSGTCGVAAVFTSFEKPVLPGAFLIRFRFSQQLNPYFLRYYINSSAGKARITRLASGAIQKNLTGTALSNMAIPLPSLKEQEGIAEICNVCDTKIAALEKEISLYEELFQALLEELMTGRLSTAPLLDKEVYNERTIGGAETDDPLRHGGRMEIRQA